MKRKTAVIYCDQERLWQTHQSEKFKWYRWMNVLLQPATTREKRIGGFTGIDTICIAGWIWVNFVDIWLSPIKAELKTMCLLWYASQLARKSWEIW